MPKSNSFGAVHLDVDAGQATRTGFEDRPAQLDPDRAFSILILGDFSGRQSPNSAPGVGKRQPILVDRDNFDGVMSRMNIRLHLRLGTGGSALPMQFAELSDFEPDRIYERYDVFRNATAQPAAGPARPSQNRREQYAATPADVSVLTSGNLLDSIVDASASGEPAPKRPKDELQGVVEKIVAPYVIGKDDEAASDAARSAKENAAVLMRAVLHHPDFQALESAWRAVWKLVHDLDTDGQLKIYLLDMRKAEIAQNLQDLTELASGQMAPRQRWAVLAGNYVFDRNDADIRLLAQLGSIARAAGAPFLAESAPPDDGAADNPDWQSLRRSQVARWIGLALPRFILRLPYTRDSYAAESFRFEEMSARPNHAHYLWGNPAFACAFLLGRSFNEYGWKLRPGVIQQIDHLALFTYTAEGDIYTQPCAEILMTEHEAEFILEQGLMPLASIKGTDSIRLVRFQSIAEPLAPLAGPWG